MCDDPATAMKATGMTGPQLRHPLIQIESLTFERPKVETVSIGMSRSQPKVLSYYFVDQIPSVPNWMRRSDVRSKGLLKPIPTQERRSTSAQRPWRQSISRIEPPRDLVKLSDRLFYVL